MSKPLKKALPEEPSPAYRRAERIWAAGDAHGHSVAERMNLAGRAAAADRFTQYWPAPNSAPVSPTHRLLRDWYFRVVENHLARGITAPAGSPIDGMLAEDTMTAVRQRTSADSTIVVDLVLELARDARTFTDQMAKAREQYVDAGLRGYIVGSIRRAPEQQLGMREALIEQWYARSFRAALEPALYKLDTVPVTPNEIYAVGINLATAQPRILYSGGEPTGPATRQAWREHATTQWAALGSETRAAWLTERAWDADRFADVPFAELPITVRSELLRQYPPDDVIMTQGLATGRPLQAAAAAFDSTPIRATREEVHLSESLYSKLGIALPQRALQHLPDPSARVIARLDDLHAANQTHREMRGHTRAGTRERWAEPEQKARAIQLRQDGKTYQQIADELGIGPKAVANGLRRHSTIDPKLVTKSARTEWTEELIRHVAALRVRGLSYSTIAASVGYTSPGSGQTVRDALNRYGPGLGIDPVTGRTVQPGDQLDPTRRAPRVDPMTGKRRTTEDPQVVAERLARNRTPEATASTTRDRSNSSDRPDHSEQLRRLDTIIQRGRDALSSEADPDRTHIDQPSSVSDKEHPPHRGR